MASSKGDKSKQLLIETAADLFLKKGYSNTGINDILSEADMSKGSFYFYFASKKDLGIEVAKYYGDKVLNKWLEPLSKNPWDVFVNQLVADIKASVAQGNYYGCPIAVLGLDISFIETELTNVYAGGIIKLIEIFSKSIQVSGKPKDKADCIARRAFTLYEGNVLLYKISKDEKAFDYMLQDLLSLV